MSLFPASSFARQDGPKPFSTEWNNAPPVVLPPRRPIALPSWVPGERALRAGLVLLVVLGTALTGAGRGGQATSRLSARSDAAVGGSTGPNAMVAAAEATAPTASSVPLTQAIPSPTESAAPPPTPTLAPAPVVAPADGAAIAADDATAGLLPRYRILSYYGHPHNASMGILGAYSRDEVLARMQQEAANYLAADPNRPIVLAFEVIASVGQSEPQNDGSYLLQTDLESLTEYADYAAANDALLFLDLQIGRSTVAADMEGIKSVLERPNVHLALDPEFAIADGETPGVHIGELTAEQIGYAQQTLAALVAELGLPPKVLIVHQFREDMIVGKNLITPVPGVQVVIDADGYGDPVLKTEVYNYLVRDEPVEFAGIKLFYDQDVPLMTAEAVLALVPSPDVIIFH